MILNIRLSKATVLLMDEVSLGEEEVTERDDEPDDVRVGVVEAS